MPNISQNTISVPAMDSPPSGESRRSPLGKIKGIASLGSDSSLPGRLAERLPGLDQVESLLNQAEERLSQVQIAEWNGLTELTVLAI
jgi:hypothetical protein